MADGISPHFPAPRPSVELTPSTPTPQLQPDVAGAVAKAHRDSLEADRDEREVGARLQSAQGRAPAGLPKDGKEPTVVSGAAAALRGEAANLGATGGGPALFDADSLGHGAALLEEVAQLQAAQNPLALGAAAVLAAISLRVSQAVPQLFVAGSEGDGQLVRLHVPDGRDGPGGPDGPGGLQPMEVAVDPGRLAAAGFEGAGASWPFFAALGLQDHMARMLAEMPGVDPWAQALAAATGRSTAVLLRDGSAERIFAALSQANPPLGLPVLVRGEGGSAFVVTGTRLGPDGAPMVELLDVAALLGGADARTSVPFAELLARLAAVLVPHGSAPLSARHQAVLSALGLTGCCMTTVAGATGGGGGRRATAVRPQGGLLEDRCLTCAGAQAACLPLPG